ncbi:MAG: NUDIX domain-containing protein [Lactobacillus sp.]|jgi:8-oxo-dGTP pyrophosphatase MutT (NUDIX family)|nr:NUDIX domain-containing protein [Lactobacillus sp.]
MNKQVFYNRYGEECFLGDAVPTNKKGYFAVLIKDDKVLVTIPEGADIPEFPGGNKQRNETPRESLYRKLYEETGVDFELGCGCSDKEFNHVVDYFSIEDKPNGRFFFYDQTFYVYDASAFGIDATEKVWKTPDGAQACWVKMKDIIKEKKKINYAHWLAFKEIFMKG